MLDHLAHDEMISIYSDDGFINFSGGRLISSKELEDIPFDVGSVWDDCLEPGEVIYLSDGIFRINEDFHLIKIS